MLRAITIVATVAALAVSAAPAWAGTSKKPQPPRPESYILNNTMISGFSARRASDKFRARHPQRNVNNVEARVGGVKDGTSNTIAYAERHASFTIDIGSSEAARRGPNGIIAVLIGL